MQGKVQGVWKYWLTIRKSENRVSILKQDKAQVSKIMATDLRPESAMIGSPFQGKFESKESGSND